MKELFLRFDQTSDIHEKYWRYKNMTHRIEEVYQDFAAFMGLEATEVRPFSNSLVIKVTQRDVERYSSQLARPVLIGNYRMFKKNSVVSKGWREVMQVLGITSFPKLFYDWLPNKVMTPEVEFEYRGFLYVRCKAKDSRLPKGCSTLSGSKFYQLLEEKERSTIKHQRAA